MEDATLQAIYLDNYLRISVQMYDKHQKQCTAVADSEDSDKRMLRWTLSFSDAKGNSAGNTWVVKKEKGVDIIEEKRRVELFAYANMAPLSEMGRLKSRIATRCRNRTYGMRHRSSESSLARRRPGFWRECRMRYQVGR